MHRAGIYRRASQDRTGEQAAVDRQGDDALQLVGHRGWTVVDTYTDNDISAAGRKRRPEFLRLLDDIRDGRLDVIVAWSLDRLVRSARDRLALIEACRASSTSIALCRGSDLDLTTAAGRLTAGVLGEVAQHEVDQKGERQRRAVTQAAERGAPPSGRRAFGWQPDHVTPHPTEAPVVVELYRRFLAGETPGELEDWLHLELGLSTPQGGRWTRKAVRIVLGNPRNAGLRGLRPTDPQTGRRARWHERTWPGSWKPIVAVESWVAADALLRGTARPGVGGGTREPRHLLSGWAWCGLCATAGVRMHMISGQRQGVRTYVCAGQRHLSRTAGPVEDFVMAVALRQAVGDAGLLAAPQDGAALLATRQRLRAQLDGLARDFADGVLDRDQVRAAGARLRERLEEVGLRLVDAGRLDPLAEIVGATNLREAAARFVAMPPAVRRQLLARLVEVTVHRVPPGRSKGGVFDPSSITVRWRGSTAAAAEFVAAGERHDLPEGVAGEVVDGVDE